MNAILNIKKILKHNLFYITILIAISFISHSYIFFDKGFLNWGDWIHVPDSSLSEMSGFKMWIGYYNFGDVMFFPNNLPFYWAASYFFTHFNFGWDTFTRLCFLVPIVFFTPISSFLLLRKLKFYPFISFLGSCIYSFNTFFLKLQMDWLTYAFIWWILPLLLFNYLKFKEENTVSSLVINSFLVLLSFIFEIRIAILLMVFFTLFILMYEFLNYSEKLKRSLLYNALSLIAGIGLNLFWIIPFVFSTSTETVAYVSSSVFSPFFRLQEVLTLKSYQWYGNLFYEAFNIQKVELRFFLLPFLVLLGLILTNLKKNKTYFIFFILYLLFVFIGKQNNPPFGFVYVWLFENVPLFNLYRESSKFLILVAICTSVLCAYGFKGIHEFLNKKLVKIEIQVISAIVFIGFVSIYNLENLYTQKIGGMAKGVNINTDLNEINKIIESDSSRFRVLWFPIKSRFSTFSMDSSAIDAKYLKDYVVSNKLCNEVSVEYFNDISKYVFCNQDLLNRLSIKYIVVIPTEERIKMTSPSKKEQVIDIYEYFLPQETFISDVDGFRKFKKIENTNIKNGAIYLNPEVGGRIQYQQGTTTEDLNYDSFEYTNFTFKIKELDFTNKILFNEKYSPSWELYVNGIKYPNEFHIKDDLGLNTFILNEEFFNRNKIKKDDNVNFTISYVADKNLESGLTISIVIGIILVLSYLFFIFKENFRLLFFKNKVSKF